MMPIPYADPNVECVIRKVGGSPEVKKHLENLGLVVGSPVTVITEMAGNLVLRVRETRVAVSRELALKLFV